MEKAAINKLEKFIKTAGVDLIDLERQIKTMSADLDKLGGLPPPKRMRFYVRQMAGAPLNNPKITQLVYSQAYAFCVRGYYALDIKTIPVRFLCSAILSSTI